MELSRAKSQSCRSCDGGGDSSGEDGDGGGDGEADGGGDGDTPHAAAQPSERVASAGTVCMSRLR